MKLKHMTGDTSLLLMRFSEEAETFAARHAALFEKIEARLKGTEATGSHPLWQGYAGQPGFTPQARRSAAQVRTGRLTSLLYAWLAATHAPRSIAEIGTAFGGSGMYWLAGLEIAGAGHLFAFEPNETWSAIARDNLASVSGSFTLTSGTFEGNLAAVTTPPDIALIDAIHDPAFVREQLRLLRTMAAPGALVVLDDIHFSPEMKAYWRRLHTQPDIAAAWQCGARTGLIQLPG